MSRQGPEIESQTALANFAEMMQQFQNLVAIGIALSAEMDRNKLLEMIISEARRISNADAGTLYLVEGETLAAKIIHNKTLNLFLGGKGEPVNLPPVPIKPEYVAGYVALTGQSVNLPDIGSPGEFDFSGPRRYEKITGYRSVSMLVIPLKNYFGEVIGVLQLINAINPQNNEIIPFNQIYQTVIEALASLAALAMTNMKLLGEIEALFESFVQVMVTAIDSRTPYNATHTEKVSMLTRLLAEEVNKTRTGPLATIFFDADRMKQLTMAAWLHDIGKIVTPLEIMNKATRLDNRLPLVLQRVDCALEQVKREALELKMKGRGTTKSINVAKALGERLQKLEAARRLIQTLDDPAIQVDGDLQREVANLVQLTFIGYDGEPISLVTPEELESLMIPRGTLTVSERKIMEEHVLVTEKMLSKIPFTKALYQVPQFARMHHEALDGTGYPYGLGGEELPIEARILAIADIFDALTASDRPYRKAMPVAQAINLMRGMVEKGKLDGDLMELFIQGRLWEMMPTRREAAVMRET